MSATSWRGKAGWTSTRGRGRRGWGTWGSSTTNPSLQPLSMSMSALLSLHTQLQLNGTQPATTHCSCRSLKLSQSTSEPFQWCSGVFTGDIRGEQGLCTGGVLTLVGVRLLVCSVFILARLKSAEFHESQQLTGNTNNMQLSSCQ